MLISKCRQICSQFFENMQQKPRNMQKNMQLQLKSETIQKYAAKTPKYANNFFYFIRMYDPESKLLERI
jgi:hypothetical protein